MDKLNTAAVQEQKVAKGATSTQEYDAIVIGLGCFGLGAAYYLQR
jgi:ribulose 1,5-bisphosphate synthetase/thiazole synthase